MTEYKLSELYELSSGISSKPEQAGHGYPFCSFSTVFNNAILPEILPDLMDTSDKDRQIYSIKAGDVFFTRTSETVGELAMSSVAVKDYPNATYSGFLKRLRPKVNGVAYPKYMAYYFRSKYFRKIVTNKAVMTLRASFNEDIFNDISVILPSYDEQVKIGDLFYAIERKIRNNNSGCLDLEAMAKQLYDYWFVQFDFPDENGKPYKTSGGKMVWNEELKREIPEGWKVETLGDIIIENAKSKVQVNEASNEGEYFFYTSGNDVLKYDEYFVDGMNCFLNTGGNPGIKGYKGKCAYSTDTWCINAAEKTYLMYYFLCNLLPYFEIMFFTGSGLKHLQKDILKKTAICIPPQTVLSNFNSIMDIAWNKNGEILSENQQLTSLRDFLLPMLMNGQVKVK